MTYELGPSAFTAASHVTLCISLLMVFHELQRIRATPDGPAIVASSNYARLGGFAILSALMVERIYYFSARMLAPLGVDLWAAHPAPAVISLIMTLAIFNVLVAGRLSLSATRREALNAILWRFCVLLSVWLFVGLSLF